MKYILVDIDGVLTDGRVLMDINSNETKAINYRDLDAISIGRKAGYDFMFVTGENTEMVKILAKRFNVEIVYSNQKDKLAAMNNISEEYGIPLNELICIGDSDRDAPALEAVGLGIAPRDASKNAQATADVITDCNGGYGVLLEAVSNIISGKWYPKAGNL